MKYSLQNLIPFANLDYKYYDPVRCMKWNATINVTGEISVNTLGSGYNLCTSI